MNNMLRYKDISEILAPLKQLGIFELARTATQATKDQESLTILYDSYRKLSKLSDPCAKMAMNQLKRDLDTADTLLRRKRSNK